jgi:hypothetical protein
MKRDRREYDRQRAQRVYADFKERKQRMIELLGGKCCICGVEHARFHLHHIIYHPTESNYPRHSKAMSVRLKRLLEAEQHPERFKLLCGKCHLAVEHVKSMIPAGAMGRYIAILTS